MIVNLQIIRTIFEYFSDIIRRNTPNSTTGASQSLQKCSKAKSGFQQEEILRQKTQWPGINKGPAIKIRVRVQLPKRVS